jgi:hypothetical protein
MVKLMNKADLHFMEVTIDAVREGAKLLDDLVPDWHTHFEYLDTIHMSDPYQCICGQLFVGKVREMLIDKYGMEKNHEHDVMGSGYQFFASYLSEVINLPHNPDYYGFEISDPDEFHYYAVLDDPTQRYEVLGEYWIAEIKMRRGEK